MLDNTPGYGDVRLPDYVKINNTQYQIDPVSTWGAYTYTFSGLDLDLSSLNVQLFRDSGRWMMLSEVSFDDGNQVPEPTSLALFGIALAGLAGALGRKKLHES